MSPDDRADFMRAVTDGLTPEDAARVSGLSLPMVMRLLSAGEEEELRILSGARARKAGAEALEFWTDFTRARAKGRRSILQAIKAAGLEDWKAYRFAIEYLDAGASRDEEGEDPALYMTL